MEKGKVGIGNKENVLLKPAKVKILKYVVEMQKDKDKKDVGEKVTFLCSHPEKPEGIDISSISYRKGKEIKTSGLWFKLDIDSLIPKQSALANLLVILKVNNLDECVGKDIETELDDKGYLCFKAY